MWHRRSLFLFEMKEKFSVDTAKIVGTPAGECWSQTHSFFPEDSEKKEKRGDLLAVLVITGVKEGIEAVASGREVLNRLHEEYFGDLEGSAFERLGNAVKKVCQEQDGVEISAAALLGNILYLAIFGEGKILLKRGSQIGTILTGSSELKTGSGIISNEDMVLIGSLRFFKTVGQGVLKASLETGSIDEAVEVLAPTILGKEDMSDAAAILAIFRKSEDSEEIEAPVVETSSNFSVGSNFRNDQAINTEVPPSPKKLFGKFSLTKERFFVKREEVVKKKKIYFVISIVFLVILAVSLFLGMKKKAADKETERLTNLVKSAELKFNQAKELYLSKPKEGKELAMEAKRIADEASSSEKVAKEASLIKEQIDKFIADTGEEVSLSDIPTFMDLNLILDNASGDAFSLNGKTLSIFDQTKKKVYLLDTEKKSNSVLDFPAEEIKYVASANAKEYIFNSKGIFEIKNSAKSSELAIKTDGEWKDISGFGSFNGNLYLLDKGASNIWRYLKSDTGFRPKSSYFVGTPPDLTNSVSISINGSVWTLGKDKISKFTLGKEDSFSISKMTETFSNPVKIYTSDTEQNLYVLDKGANKVFVIGKDGVFKTSYSWEGIKGVTDLVSVEAMKKILLLSGSKIFEIQIK